MVLLYVKKAKNHQEKIWILQNFKGYRLDINC